MAYGLSIHLIIIYNKSLPLLKSAENQNEKTKALLNVQGLFF